MDEELLGTNSIGASQTLTQEVGHHLHQDDFDDIQPLPESAIHQVEF